MAIFFFPLLSLAGDLSDNHDVIGVKTYELELPEGAVEEDRSGECKHFPTNFSK